MKGLISAEMLKSSLLILMRNMYKPIEKWHIVSNQKRGVYDGNFRR